MRLAAYGVIASVFAVGLPEPAVQYTALTILGSMLWYLMARAFPAHLKAQRDATAAFLAEQDRARRDFRRSLRSLNRGLDKLATAVQDCPRKRS